ncbi:SusC/RagA family TonB-linked outer membrane protein [Tunicatimonas pelagia]|uniref:SusC/RagA family TonB-linked outer membrane protein n=1 Tax=Tunicatimonas pelagia TaxID=931531 RepID=UPI002666219F|nr:SusC/RagA family TonB-linked outer membrane protein [Tunicatimonas pelagia]WKN43166.1 SusC/RagA family TonB-linked outer membrane protein [Tunicatimonas pelagia]
MFTNNLMKLVFVLSIVGWVSLSAVEAQLIASTEATPTFKDTDPTQSAEKEQLTDLLQNLQEMYGASFMYERHLLQNQSVLASIDAEADLETNLKQILQPTKLRFKKIDNETYVIILADSAQEVRQVNKQPLRKSSGDSGMMLPSTSLTSSISVANWNGSVSSAVDRDISGTVTDEDNEPLPGVNVLAKNTTIGTITDVDGNYRLTIPDDAEVLVFSSVGYAAQEVAINGRSIVDLSMNPDVTELGEVVVTALGIEKDSRTLGYATSTVDPEEFTVNRTPNVMNALQGKIAGVNISGLGTGPGGTSKIRIRGQSSISGQNNPLIVINGVPIDNTNFGTNPGGNDDNALGNNGNGFTSDGGDGLNSINPDDIENMTVLKGAAAAALYGSRAKDGVIMITTKKGKGAKGIGVTYNLNYTNEQPLDFTDYQYEYGQGENGVRPTSPNPTSGQWSFGERIEPGMTQILFDGIEVPYVAQRDRIDKFFRNGQNVTNTVSIAAGGENGSLNLSLSNLSSQGIVPNNTFRRRTINLGFQYELSKKLSVTGAINYSNEHNENPPNVAQQDNTIPVALYNMANTMPLDLLDANKFNEDGDEFVYSRFRNRTNPYFTLSEQFQEIRRDRVFGNIAVKYDLADWIYVQGRIGQDYWSRDQSGNNYPTGQASRPRAPDGFVNGTFTQEARRFREINTDILVNAYREFGDFGLNVSAGGNIMYRRSDRNLVEVDDFVIRDLYTVENGRVKDPQYDLAERGVNSLYASAELSYRDMFYLTGTFRNDWFSTLSPENRSISYPSVSASYVFTESFNSSPGWLDFGKLRAAYAEVGSDTDVQPYSNVLFYEVRPNLFTTPDGVAQPVIQVDGNSIPNPDLRPMRANEAEIGLELQMFNSRVGLDVAVYQKTTSDQIVSAQVSEASGFDNTLINTGESRTRGFEFLLNLVLVQTEDFQWNISFNGMYNITEVLSLQTDSVGETITVGSHVFNGFLQQVVGQEIGQLAGFGYRRTPDGRQIFGDNGVALRTEDLVTFGSALPNWVGGITNSFNYKGISFSFLIDFKLGNMMMSGTNFNATRHGLHKMTLPGREGGVVGDGVVIADERVNSDGEVEIIYAENTTAADPQTYWEVVRSQQLVEPIVYDGGYWKLRQISLGYDFSRFLPESFPAKAVTLNFVANNVFIIQKWVPNIDPESFGFSSDNLVGLESTGLPTTRGLGFNLNVKF